MTKQAEAPTAAEDGFTRFHVRVGVRLISCDVSDEALEAVSGLTVPSSSSMRRRSFDRFRTLIDAAAKLKLKDLSAGFSGPLVLSSGDLRRVPAQTGVPAYGSAPRGT